MFEYRCTQQLPKFDQTCDKSCSVEASQTYSIQPDLFIMHNERMANEDMRRPDVRTGRPSAQRHYDLMPHKPAMPECPSTTFSNPSNASKLFSPAFTEERANRRKGGQIFEEGTISPDSRRHLRLQTDSCHQSTVIRIAATCVSLSSNSNQNVIYL